MEYTEAGSLVLDRVIDATALGAYNRCPRLYDLSMRRHWHVPGATSAPLTYGTIWHVIMEQHYKSDGDLDTVRLETILAAIPPSDHPDDHRTMERALLEYEEYLKKYGRPSQIANERTLGTPPDKLMLEIAANVADPALLYPYAGKLDRIFSEGRLIYVEDHKTASRMEKGWGEKYKLSQQMMGYAWLAGKLLGEPVAGVRINLHVIRKNDSEFDRFTVSFSPERLDEWVENTNNTIRDIQHSYATGNFRGVYTDGGCSGKYGMCSFANVCRVRPGLRQAVLEQDYIVAPWDPLTASEMPSD